jgi:hypothetical protein
LSESVVLSLVGGAGVIVPWGPGWEVRSTCVSDRFLLGGVGNGLRGFSHAGCGPTDARREACSVWGMYTAVKIYSHRSTPKPFALKILPGSNDQ